MKISFAKFCEHLINQKLNELKNIFDDDIVFLLNYQNNKDYDEYIYVLKKFILMKILE